MKTRIALAAVCCAALFGGILYAAQDSGMKVKSSRSMQLAIIEEGSHTPLTDQMHQALADSLGFELSQRCKSPVPVKANAPDVQRASFGLSNGVYDVVIVIGAKMPPALVHSECRMLKATPVSGDMKRVVWMIIRQDDPGLAAMLESAFPDALKEQFFQKALAKFSGKSGPDEIAAEWRVASMGGAAGGQP